MEECALRVASIPFALIVLRFAANSSHTCQHSVRQGPLLLFLFIRIIVLSITSTFTLEFGELQDVGSTFVRYLYFGYSVQIFNSQNKELSGFAAAAIALMGF
jgi:hypothetical protein